MSSVDRAALAHAAGVRSSQVRAERLCHRNDVRAGRVSVADLLTDPPPCLGSMRVWDLLAWQPRFGTGRKGGASPLLSSLLADVGASEFRRVRELSDRQRGALVSLLGVGR